MPKHKYKFTGDFRREYICFWRGHNEFEVVGSVANGGCLDIEVHLETTKHKKYIRGERSLFKINNFFVQPGS
jgi:hypothetical protein